MLAFLLAWVGTALHGWPLPTVHDEFSFLLAGETLAAGRLSNPAHALPQFFETFHVLQTPSYASKYFPGHAFFIAAGLLIGDSARLGQWLAVASAAMALVWCLRGWVPRKVAWAVTAVAMTAIAGTSWTHGFWGSPVAMLGSALVFGAFGPRRGEPGPWTGIAAGTGAALLALTRPWEGFWVCIPPSIAMAWWLARSPGPRAQRMTRVVLPGVAVLAVGLLFVAGQNQAVTGSWRLPPYVLYEASAAGAPPFVWQQVEPTERPLRATERARVPFDLAPYDRLRTAPLRALLERARWAIDYFGGIAVAVCLLLVACAPRRRPYALPLASLGAGVAAISVSSFFMPHYLSTLLPPIIVLTAAGATALWQSRHAARFFVPLAYGAAAIAAIVRLSVPTESERLVVDPAFWANRRAVVAKVLEDIPGKHLVFVRYDSTYHARHEWVQNRADRDTAKILWAHDLGDNANATLLAAERGRRAWRIEIDSSMAPARSPQEQERVVRDPHARVPIPSPYVVTNTRSADTPPDPRPRNPSEGRQGGQTRAAPPE